MARAWRWSVPHGGDDSSGAEDSGSETTTAEGSSETAAAGSEATGETAGALEGMKGTTPPGALR
ncbi:MAG: hypothetical protein R2749_04295 [Acidimicrobiales bacterium]